MAVNDPQIMLLMTHEQYRNNREMRIQSCPTIEICKSLIYISLLERYLF